MRNFDLLTPGRSILGGGDGEERPVCWNQSADDFAAHKIAFVPVPDHLRAAHAAKGTERGHEIDRFEDVGLALRVVAQKQMEAGREVRVQPRVIPEVAQAQVSQMHAARMRPGGVPGEIFSIHRRFAQDGPVITAGPLVGIRVQEMQRAVGHRVGS